MVRTGVMRAYGGGMRRAVGRATTNRLTAFGIGLGVATALQSSTAVALLAVAFASKGILSTASGLAIMLGADLGSTLVVLILSFDISWLSPLLVLAGVVVFMIGSSQFLRQIGRALLGLGLILLSLSLIVGASVAIRDSVVLQNLLHQLATLPLIALAVGALLTWLMHSSVAMTLLIMTLVAVGVAPLNLGFALVLGANVGSGIIPLVLNWRGVPTARRILFGNFAFRLIGAVCALVIMNVISFEALPFLTSPSFQIAGFHILFNLLLGVFFLPLVNSAAHLSKRMFPDSTEETNTTTPRYLDEGVIDQPGVALGCATREILRIADSVEVMLAGVMNVFDKDDEELLKKLKNIDDDIDILHESIKFYLTKVSRNTLNAKDSARCVELIIFTTNLEHIGDIIDKNLLELARKKIKYQLAFSTQGWKEICEINSRVLDQMQLAMSVFMHGDIDTARQLVMQKDELRGFERDTEEGHLARLRKGSVESIETTSLHMDIIRDFKRINSHLTSVAYPILDATGELRPSRLKKQSRNSS